jgi:hypothetical protein
MDKQEAGKDIRPDIPKTAILVGTGQRGHGYSYYAATFPKELKVKLLFPYFYYE